MLYRAAASGLGLALGIDAITKPYLDDGQLIQPFGFSRKLIKGYYVVCRNADWTRRPVCTFREWLMLEARDDTT
jgi:LysR family glycine cleavage system transcriptional activator